MPGMFEMILIFLAILLIFGAKRIPEIARGVGQGIREFKSATNEITSEITKEDKQVNRPKPPQQGTPTPRAQSSTAAQDAAAQNPAPSAADEGPAEPRRAENPGSAEPEQAHS